MQNGEKNKGEADKKRKGRKEGEKGGGGRVWSGCGGGWEGEGRRAGEFVLGVYGDAGKEIFEGETDQKRRNQAAARHQPVPVPPPPVALAFAAELERDPAGDQSDEQDNQHEVEAGEHRRVPVGERGKRSGRGDDEPDL